MVRYKNVVELNWVDVLLLDLERSGVFIQITTTGLSVKSLPSYSPMDPSTQAPIRPLAFFKQLLHYLSLGASFSLVLLSVLGFNQLSKTSVNSFEQAESTTSDGCLLFLGLAFGTLLLLGEFKWELFFFFFGFLRYRIGRAILYAVSGIMTILMGRTRSSCTSCLTYSLLIAEGVGLLVIAVCQLVSIVPFGNTTAPPGDRRTDSAKATLAPSTQRPVELKQVVIETNTAAKAPPTSPFESTTAPKTAPPSPKNSNTPSWMHAYGASTEVHRRRILIREYNKQSGTAVTNRLRAAFLAIPQTVHAILEPPLTLKQVTGYVSLADIAHVLSDQLHVKTTPTELQVALRRLGCTYNEENDLYSYEQLVAFSAPRNFESPNSMVQDIDIWMACKTGDINRLVQIVETNDSKWHKRDNFDNLPLYYASLCGRQECIEYLLYLYNLHQVDLDAQELHRCITNALSGDIRRILMNAQHYQTDPRLAHTTQQLHTTNTPGNSQENDDLGMDFSGFHIFDEV